MKCAQRLAVGKKQTIRRFAGWIGAMVLFGSGLAAAQSWHAVTPFPGQGAGTALLRTDGTVLVQETTGQASQGGWGPGNWFVLTPDKSGFYTSGTWSQTTFVPR
jgi:hypothetical protein